MLADVLGREPRDLGAYYLYRAELLEAIAIADRGVVRGIISREAHRRRVNEITRQALENELVALDAMCKAGAFDTPEKRVIGMYP